MKNQLTKALGVALVLASAFTGFSASAHLRSVTNSQLILGEPETAGTGCPIGSVGAVVSPDQKQLSILFDQYIAEAGINSPSGRNFDRKNCSIAIPLTVPQGFSVSLIKVDYRGFTSIPRGGSGSFSVEYFFAGSRGPRLTETFRSGREGEYLLTDELEATALVWSACGAQTNLRINSSLLVRTNRSGDDAMATLDSTDVDTNVVYHLAWKRCSL